MTAARAITFGLGRVALYQPLHEPVPVCLLQAQNRGGRGRERPARLGRPTGTRIVLIVAIVNSLKGTGPPRRPEDVVCALHETHGFPRIQAVGMPRLRGAAPAVRSYCTPAVAGVNTARLDPARSPQGALLFARALRRATATDCVRIGDAHPIAESHGATS
jgi:hypothetical protein